MGKKIYTAIERGETDIPLAEVMEGNKLDIFEDIQAKQFFNFSLKKDRLVLYAGNHIGLIPLNENVALLVEPKIGRSNWLYIVSRTGTYLTNLNYLRLYSLDDKASKSIVEFLSRAYIHLLNPINELGIYRRYEQIKEVTSYPKGRILIGGSIRHVWSRGRDHSVEIDRYLFTKDIPHNRLLRYALEIAVENLSLLSNGLLNNRTNENVHVGQIMKEVEDLLRLVPLDHSLSYIPKVIHSLEREEIPPLREYYIEACNTALLLVNNSGIVPELEGAQKTLSFVVNMESVFEDYCRTALKDSAEKFGWLSVLSGKDDHRYMFSGQDCDNRYAEPDIVINMGNENNYPIEVKYKDSPNRGDINQAITYALAYKKKKAILLCYSADEQHLGWKSLGMVGESINVWVYYINLESKSIEEEERKMTLAVNQVICE